MAGNFTPHACVDDNHEGSVPHAVDDGIIDGCAVLVQKYTVGAPPVFDGGLVFSDA